MCIRDRHLTIRDSNGALVDRSVNSVPSFTVPGQSTSTFFFPALPELSTCLLYTSPAMLDGKRFEAFFTFEGDRMLEFSLKTGDCPGKEKQAPSASPAL